MRTPVNRERTDETKDLLKRGKVPRSKVQAYERLLDRIEKDILTHDVIVNNRFTRWFKDATLDRQDMPHFPVQFPVLPNLFIEAQLKKVINAPPIQAMHASKEILMNELGVVFRK